VLEINAVAARGKPFLAADNDYRADEEQFQELAEHLLKTYAGRRRTFILQHWEGDWLLRGGAKEQWSKVSAADAQARCASFARWLAARQRGVERARSAAPPAGAAARQCNVYHAAEVNRVWDAAAGLVTVASHVLPQVAVDLVSWLSYDGMQSAVTFLTRAAAQGRRAVCQRRVGRHSPRSTRRRSARRHRAARRLSSAALRPSVVPRRRSSGRASREY
jgi:hypothetical protein